MAIQWMPSTLKLKFEPNSVSEDYECDEGDDEDEEVTYLVIKFINKSYIVKKLSGYKSHLAIKVI